MVIISLVFINFKNRYPLSPALLLTITIFVPTVLITHFLSNRLLKTMMHANKMKIFLFWFLTLSFLLSLIYALIDHGFRLLLERGIFSQPPSMTKSTLLLQFMSALPTPILINLGFCGLRFYYEHTKLRETHLKSQLHFLQQQINPHFMFNILNNIHVLMQKDADVASQHLVKYADILRYQLYGGKQQWVTLKQEIQFLKDVIDMETMRWGEALEVKTNWQIKDENKSIQPLLLIPFVENAFKHVSRSLSEKGFVHISAKQNNQSLYLEVRNSKIKAICTQSKNNLASGIGLQNIKERLRLLYPSKHILKINESANTYEIQLTLQF